LKKEKWPIHHNFACCEPIMRKKRKLNTSNDGCVESTVSLDSSSMESKLTHDSTPSGEVTDSAPSSQQLALQYLTKFIPAIKPVHRNTIIYVLPTLIADADPLVFFKQHKKQQLCALYAVWNYLGRNDIITLDDCITQLELMHHYQYLKDRVKRLSAFISEKISEKPKKKVTQLQMADYMKTQMLGNYSGNFSMNVMAECLSSVSNLQYKRLNKKRKEDYLTPQFFGKLLNENKSGVIVIFAYKKFGIEQMHVITIKNDTVYDCNHESGPYVINLELEVPAFAHYVLDVYRLQTHNHRHPKKK
jgi:hypothetical protein